MTARPPAPLRIVSDGLRHGVEAGGKVAWLPASMWAAAAALVRQMATMNERAERVERLYREAEDAAWSAASEAQIAAAMRDD